MATYSLNVQDIDISDEDVTRLLDKLDAEKSQTRVEQRSVQRDDHRGRAMLIVMQASLPPASAHWVRLRNISEQGIAFLKHGALPLDAFVRLELPTGCEIQTMEKYAVVRHCRQIQGMVHEIGVEFLPDGHE